MPDTVIVMVSSPRPPRTRPQLHLDAVFVAASIASARCTSIPNCSCVRRAVNHDCWYSQRETGSYALSGYGCPRDE